MSPTMIQLDGSYGEGGGQILRTALTLSVITGKPFELTNIRAKRPKPGLRPQHLTCVKAAQKISGAQVEGARVGSLELCFSPGALRPGSYYFDIGTAGAVSLVFQTIGPALAFGASPSKVTLKGGTHVPHAPSFHYLAEVYGPVVQRLGFVFSFELRRYGFYPAGGGEVRIKIYPRQKAAPLILRGPYQKKEVTVLSVVTTDLPSHIRTRQAKAASARLTEEGFRPLVVLEKAEAASPGTFVFLKIAEDPKRAGFISLGRKGKPAEMVALEATTAFLSFYRTGKAVDPYLADQLLLPLVLAEVPFHFDASLLTQHFFTNLWVIQKFFPEFRPEISGELEQPGEVKHLF